ncbi:hypothetical protein [Enterococcus gallinarum]|jgi:hypothetical protein|uniref:Uncharacterized protein n=1 Tax=Enterococcus gallinarum TaxID=1353 RepID=A0ABD4HMS4_ENTGA|nr:hypothetical protein [Enterococcus gallinarum]MBA0947939.1 hypothetical protein [Enterococcus gallinarum]MBA0961568.1 hypothetical protein [Enterococcus gallinarum]MBA0969481.1 hypothetical protein [Enterococcus gallinarum]MBA0972768.1 hypothetical protein [Enterococcus gallinarum]NVI96342.1 hypothetical protein [Enterococcus gallinarum]
MVKRTKKAFLDYNEFRDRPFGLKWGTAYTMDELVKGIKENEAWATKEVAALELMNREQIDVILSESFLYHKPVSIQLNTKDELGRLLDLIEGLFVGEAYEDYFVINDQQIFWPDVRHIEIKKEEKWFNIDYFSNLNSSSNSKIQKDSKIENEIELVKNEYYQPFLENDSR